MQFKDAAYEILKEAGRPLHYNEITDKALNRDWLETTGKTPHATMGALLYTDTLNDDSRFQREGKGKFFLRSTSITGIAQQIKTTESRTRQELRNRLLQMPPQKFEELIQALLELMGFEETETTPYANDKGVDVKGILKTNQLTPVKVVIQAKRWKGNVGSNEVRNLRGSLSSTGEQGIIITPKDFTLEARSEAQAGNKIPVTLINGEELVGLLFQYKLGIKEEQYTIHSLDSEYWLEAFGVNLGEPISTPAAKKRKIKFPIIVQAQHKGELFEGELLNIQGGVYWNGKEYPTPSSAAKAIASDWKEVNGWRFWKYQDHESGEWEYIGKLREE